MDSEHPIDVAAPWTIKSVPTATRDAVTRAARREGLTVGQWLERRVREWEAEGAPVPVAPADMPPVDLAGLAHAMDAARALATDAKVPVPPQLAKDGLALIRLAIRQARGMPPRRSTKSQRLIEAPWRASDSIEAGNSGEDAPRSP